MPSGSLDQLLERPPMSLPLFWMLLPSCSTWNLTAKVNIFLTLPSSGGHFLTQSLSTTRPRDAVVSFLLPIAVLDHYHLSSLPLAPSSVSYAINVFHTHPSEQQLSEDLTFQITLPYSLKILAPGPLSLSLHESFYNRRVLLMQEYTRSALAS